MQNSMLLQKNTLTSTLDDSLAPEATATIPFSGTGIRIYGLKTSALGKALVTLDGKEMPALDFYTQEQLKKVH